MRNEYLTSIGIEEDGKQVGDKFVIELDNSNEYQDLFEFLNDISQLEMGEVIVDENYNEVNFYDGEETIKLIADFEKEIYELNLIERK